MNSDDSVTEPDTGDGSDSEPGCPSPPGDDEPWCEDWGFAVKVVCCIIVPIPYPPYYLPVPFPLLVVWCKEGYLA